MELLREAPKIVQIETRYVQTDAANFRNVVQSLTGKNSSTDWIGQNYNNAAAAASYSSSKGRIDEPKKLVGASASNGTKETTLLPFSIQMNNNVSFDGLMLPPFEKMPWSYP